MCRWPTLLVINVPKIVVNGQFQFNLSSKTWSHVFLEHSVVTSVIHTALRLNNIHQRNKTVRTLENTQNKM